MTARRDELHDEEADLADPGPLGEYLRLCRDRLAGPFREADREALASQRWYRRVTGSAAALGGASLVLASVHIAYGESAPRILQVLEAVFAALATALVLVGIVRGWHGGWLLRRFQAEQLRLVKFRFLVDPDFWCEGGPSAPEPRDRFLREIERIRSIEETELDGLAANEDVPRLPSDASCGAISEPLRLEILAYYRRSRLDRQIGYFVSSGRRGRHWYESPALLPLVFFVSVLCVVLHAWAERVAEGGARHEGAVEALGQLALVLSLALPGAWAGVRTWRSANEFGRNHARSLARQRSLSKIADRLSPSAPAVDVFAELGLAEHILAADQGEWLRLMREAEWYG